MKVTVFGATGVVGSALLPLLVSDHELVAVSRSARARFEPPTRGLEVRRLVYENAGSAAVSSQIAATYAGFVI
jgi:uncharacterized protein YbjT (DUF2867 family)